MKLSELLEHTAGHLLDDRTDMVSGASDSLFSDETIVRYLNEAQKILARRAWVIEDSATASCCDIDLVENQREYPLHKSVLFVKSMRLSDSDVDFIRVGYDDNRARGGFYSDPDFFDVNDPYTETPGRPGKWSPGTGYRTIRVGPKPDATAAALTLKLSVVRLPLVDLSVSAMDASPEVPEDHHMALCNYAAGRALTSSRNIDSDSQVIGRGLLKAFADEVRLARVDRERLQQTTPQWRYGGWVNNASR